ncbi:MAG: molybdopterin molybdotransferase MoeA [Sediminibacterium sp.]|nr:molybdopterin molybdotransferase MoeA [Sediminibacterium sp.]
MKTVQEARQIVGEHASPLGGILQPVATAAGYVLSAPVYSPVSVPGFPQSSMDGYALRVQDRGLVLPVQDELPAGSTRQVQLIAQQAIRVFTGGPVPEGADAIVQKEWVVITNEGIRIQEPERVVAGTHIRMPGADIQAGDMALAEGTLLQAYMVSYLSGLGLTHVEVYSRPKVSLVITGNELVQPGHPLQYGQVYESNSYGLTAALYQAGIEQVQQWRAEDTLAATEQAIAAALKQTDVLLLTGGVSVGEYDYVVQACLNQGVELLFHGVKQRPGKPLFFGKKGRQLVFGLPGNPASVLSCYQQYVLPALHQITGRKTPTPQMAKLAHAYEKKGSLTVFLKGHYDAGVVTVLPAQASFQLSAFAMANCWIELDESVDCFAALQLVPVHLF